MGREERVKELRVKEMRGGHLLRIFMKLPSVVYNVNILPYSLLNLK